MRASGGPTFLCIGAQKAGTTWLYDALNRADGVYVPPVKELHHFDRLDKKTIGAKVASADQPDTGTALYKKNKGRRQRTLARLRGHLLRGEFRTLWFYYQFLGVKRDDAWYDALFPRRFSVAGEITPEYALLSDEMIGQITQRYPDIKVLYLLRNPIDRAWSQFRYELVRAGWSDVGALYMNASLHNPRMGPRGFYPRHVQAWRAHLKPGHLMLGFYDALTHRPQVLLDEIAAFIGSGPLKGRAERVYATGDADLPDDFMDAAMKVYADTLVEMDGLWGGYCSDWAAGTLCSEKDRPAALIL